MIEHERDRWPVDPAARPRRWMAHMPFPGAAVVLRHYAVLAPGEHLDEYPPTVELTWDEWLTSHADYGLDVDGNPLQPPE